MWIKVVIVLLFIALVASLFSGYVFLMKDKGSTNRTWNSLSVRLILAALLMGFLIYGVYTGKLGSRAPWDAAMGVPAALQPAPQEIPQQPTPLKAPPQ
jgi:hypothetical protein